MNSSKQMPWFLLTILTAVPKGPFQTEPSLVIIVTAHKCTAQQNYFPTRCGLEMSCALDVLGSCAVGTARTRPLYIGRHCSPERWECLCTQGPARLFSKWYHTLNGMVHSHCVMFHLQIMSIWGSCNAA